MLLQVPITDTPHQSATPNGGAAAVRRGHRWPALHVGCERARVSGCLRANLVKHFDLSPEDVRVTTPTWAAALA